MKSADAQLREFIARYSPPIAKRARAVLAKMRQRLAGATELVYDNYNGLVIGFAPSERASEAPFSIVVYPKYVRLFFLDGADLPDPDGLLDGSGKIVRSIVVDDAAVIDRPAVKRLMTEAIRKMETPFPKAARRRLFVRSVVAKQRPRRPPVKW
jgi:hypothetical protein